MAFTFIAKHLANMTGNMVTSSTPYKMAKEGMATGREAYASNLRMTPRYSGTEPAIMLDTPSQLRYQSKGSEFRRISHGVRAGLNRQRGLIMQSGVVRPARAAYGAGRFAVKNIARFAGPAFVGYEISKGKNLPEGIVRGAAEATKLGAAALGAAAGTAVFPVVGTLIGGFAGYLGVDAILKDGFGKPRQLHPEVYQNRRALTMRQASVMALSRSKRNAFGNEASNMHLR